MGIISISTICYCSLFNFCSRAKLRSFNPLWGHCQEYKILQERLASENRSIFANCNLTLSESICLNDHEKQIQKFVAPEKFAKNHLKGKSSRRMHTKPPNRKVCGSQRCISSPPGHWQTPKLPQQGRILSDQTIHFETTLSSRSQLESSAGKPFTSSSTIQTPRPELRTTSPQGGGGGGLGGGGGGEGKRNFRGSKRQLFLQKEGLFKASTWSLVSQLHVREKWRRCGDHNYQKIRLECTWVTIDWNRSMASQRVY